MYSNCSEAPELLGWQAFRLSWARSLTITFLALVLGAPAPSQAPPHPAESIAEAARNLRERKSNSTSHPKIITNDDFGMQYPVPSASTSPLVAEVTKPRTAECDNADAERLKTNLLVAQGEQDQIHRELSNYAEDAAGKARLDVELQQTQFLQSEIERLKGELAASKANQPLK